MLKYQVSWEISIDEEDAKTPLEAAKYATFIMRDKYAEWQFYIQDYETKQIYSVNLEQLDEDAVEPVINYKPIIET